MNVTAPAAGDAPLPENCGEEIQILTLDPTRLAKLQKWSESLNISHEAFLLSAIDLLCGRLAKAAKISGCEIVPGNPVIFRP